MSPVWESDNKKLPVFLSEEEQEEIIKQPNPRWPTGQRNLTIINFLLGTGARVSEITKLEWQDINLNTGHVLFRQAKGKKDRTIYMDSYLIEIMRKWRERQDESFKKTDYVFSILKGGPVSTRYIQQMIKRYKNKAGIKKNVTPHSLRHTFATDTLNATGNIRRVQDLLGHKFVSTTMIYTHITDEDKKDSAVKLQEYRDKMRQERKERQANKQ